MRNAGGTQEQCCWDSRNKERRGHVIKQTVGSLVSVQVYQSANGVFSPQ